jgi:hypothetical protein
MHSVEIHAGRLVEITLRGPVSVDDVRDFRGLMASRVMSVPGRVVICGDLRSLEYVEDEVKVMLIGIMRADNPRLVRSGHVVTAGTRSAKQVIEAIRESQSDDRKCFTEVSSLAAYLGEVLEPFEKVRLHTFLDVVARAS